MGDIEEFHIHAVKIDLDPDKRIDKSPTGSSLHPAQLKDAGKPNQGDLYSRFVAKGWSTLNERRC